MATVNVDIPPVAQFDVTGSTANLSQKWSDWQKRFNYYILAKGVTENAQKRALLLHLSGPAVQDIFETLPDTGGADDYAKACDKLKEYFAPKKNLSFETHEFRQITQGPHESMDSFVARLRKGAAQCEFGDLQIRMIQDQIMDKCADPKLRRRLLGTPDLDLEKILTIARTTELANDQAERMESKIESRNQEHVNAANYQKTSGMHQRHKNNWQKNRYSHQPKQTQATKQYQANTGNQQRHTHKNSLLKCYRCGREGHQGSKCDFARDKYCDKCGLLGHFAAMCRTRTPTRKQNRPQGQRKSSGAVNTVYDENYEQNFGEDDHYVFALENHNKTEKVSVIVNKTKVQFLIDSGATVNLMDAQTFKAIKNKKSTLKKSQLKIFPYGSDKPLDLLGSYSTSVQVAGKEFPNIIFHVVSGQSGCLLGKNTAVELGLIQFNIPPSLVNNVETSNLEELLDKYKGTFEGLGKLKDYQLKLHIDRDVHPIAQPMRRIPFLMRQKVENKVEELINSDIIERVKGPTSWVSPLVVVPKPSGDIRICLDMRQANTAVKRERFPIPTIEEVLQDLNGAAYFSVLDLRSGYHQIELHPDSRDITTFICHKGLFQYKRLIFGVTSAAEAYQKILQQVLQGLKGCRNISDDIIVFGKTKTEHNQNLEKVLARLSEHNLTLNKDKCKLAETQLQFMGHTLTNNGFEPDKRKIEAIQQTKPPTSPKEIRSFLGLVQYCAKFIKNYATLSEPLRELTRKNATWQWTDKHQTAFEDLRNCLTKHDVLAYVTPDEPFKLIVDASPVGLGVILTQRQKDQSYKPISYASRTLTQAERNYSQTEREALGVYWGIDRFRMYLQGSENFIVVTDHKPLEIIYNSKTHNAPPRIQRWIMRLQGYIFTVKYEPGPTNAADLLSRSPLPLNEQEIDNIGDDYVNFVAHHAVPKALTYKEIVSNTLLDDTLCKVHKSISNNKWDKNDPNVRPYYTQRTNLSINDDLVLRNERIVIPASLRPRVLDIAHEGHQGIVKCKLRLREKVWWPAIDRDIEQLIESCHACQVTSRPSVAPPVSMTPLPNGPWEKLGADICGPFPTGEYLFVIIDYYSRYPVVEIIRSITATSIVNCLNKVFATHGLPLQIMTDNGSQFISEEFGNFMEENNISHHRVTPYWPAANGEVERFNKVLKKAIQTSHTEGKDWKFELYKFLLAYRTTPHCTTNESPAYLLMNRKVKSKLPEIKEYKCCQKLKAIDKKKKEIIALNANKSRKQLDWVKEGDQVLIRQKYMNKLSTNFEPRPYKVVKISGPSVTVKSQNGNYFRRHRSHIRKYIGPDNSRSSISPDSNKMMEIYDDDYNIPHGQPQQNVAVQQNGNPHIPPQNHAERPARNHVLPYRLRDYILK